MFIMLKLSVERACSTNLGSVTKYISFNTEVGYVMAIQYPTPSMKHEFLPRCSVFAERECMMLECEILLYHISLSLFHEPKPQLFRLL